MIDGILFVAGHALLAGLLWHGGRLGLGQTIQSTDACPRAQRLGHLLSISGAVRRCR